MKTKRIIKVAAFCLILALFLSHLYDVFSWKDTAGDYMSTMDTLYKFEEDLVDVMFVGSSRCYCSINNATLWDEYGIASFNMSISGQDIASSYYTIVEALKTQTPDIICFETFGTLFYGYLVESNLYRNALPYTMSLNAFHAVNDIGGEKARELLLKWPIVHTRYKELKKEDFETERLAYLGYSCGFEAREVGALCTYDGEEQFPIGENEEKWLRKIIELAKEKGIQLCFFAAPFESSAHDQMRLNYVQAIADENQIPMINMSKMQEELQLNGKTDFTDWMHTNYWGSQKVTKYMGQFLVDNFEIVDRRGQEGYGLWEENSKVRQHELDNHFLQQTGTVDDFFAQLSFMTDRYTVIVEANGEYYTDAALIDAYATSLGIVDMDGRSAVWVIENGEAQMKLEGADFGEYFELGDSDMLITRQGGVSNIIIDDQTYIKTWDGVNVIVYDTLMNEVVDAIAFTPLNQYALIR